MGSALYSPDEASMLAERSLQLGEAAGDLVSFFESNPELASLSGVEVQAIEARGILRSGAIERISGSASLAGKSGRSVQLSPTDLDAVSRLEAILSSSSDRIATRLATMGPEKTVEEKLGTILGLAGSAISLVRSIF